MRPRALLFDFGGTLDADGVAWKERFYRLFTEEGLRVPPEAFDAAFYAADDALVGRVPREFCLEETVESLSRGVEAYVGTKGGVAGEVATPGAGGGHGNHEGARSSVAPRVAARFLAEARRHLSKNLPVLSRLSEHYKLGVVSNFYGNLEAVCESAGLAQHLGVIVDSHVAGFRKPDKRIFLAALSTLGVSPAGAAMIGDSWRRDMEGAKALGIGCVWLVPEGADASAADGSVCVIRRLCELEAAL